MRTSHTLYVSIKPSLRNWRGKLQIPGLILMVTAPFFYSMNRKHGLLVSQHPAVKMQMYLHLELGPLRDLSRVSEETVIEMDAW